MEMIAKSPNETRRAGADFSRKLVSGVVGLVGDLGAGKTTFVQGMAEGLGIDPRHYVNSPTFTLVNEYPPLIHVDLYRLEREEELETLALQEYFQGNLVVIEWAEKFPSLKSQLDFLVRFEIISDKERKIRIERTEEKR